MSQTNFFFSAKSALFGTMRHQLFEATMIEKDFSKSTIWQLIKAIVRDNAEGILSCNTSSVEASKEVIKVYEQLINFVTSYTSFLSAPNASSHKGIVEGHSANTSSTTFVVEEVEAVEEPLISPELGLKGNIDMIANAKIGSSSATSMSRRVLVGIELKTGHIQKTQNAHLAQLALYILMMKSRYGVVTAQQANEVCAAESGILLYLNNESVRAVNVAPSLAEIKSLIFQRNLVATEQVRATAPRDVMHDGEQKTDVAR
jgi:DNA replication ATP-dependent helicase Dna2